ncbi:LysE family translocator [Temperatibacter marinus]|uniref:LysE family translocator n=1 Tax=Temperatibacter marinus TaxID=1456591 RepID=A0AA52ECJ4_9PROT|nr:LysE family translocator [Temperatibacter marinus]WND02266.1 LysE family translocator [Temperatibacter marinus]
MIDPVLYSFFILASAALVASPGPTVSLIVAETLKNGKVYGFATITGAFFAGSFYFLLYYFGAAVFLEGMNPVYFDLMRYGGIVMLVWMAWKMFKASGTLEDTKGIRADKSPFSAALRGFFICISSPKSVIFFAAFFPQFINKGLPFQPQILLMGIGFLIVGVLSDLLWIFISLKAKDWIYRKGGHGLINKISGSVLSLGAVALLFIN